jgi:hypothetical protein
MIAIMTCLFCWEFYRHSLEIFLTRPLEIDQIYPNAPRNQMICLLTAMEDDINPYIQYLGTYELWNALRSQSNLKKYLVKELEELRCGSTSYFNKIIMSLINSLDSQLNEIQTELKRYQQGVVKKEMQEVTNVPLQPIEYTPLKKPTQHLYKSNIQPQVIKPGILSFLTSLTQRHQLQTIKTSEISVTPPRPQVPSILKEDKSGNLLKKVTTAQMAKATKPIIKTDLPIQEKIKIKILELFVKLLALIPWLQQFFEVNLKRLTKGLFRKYKLILWRIELLTNLSLLSCQINSMSGLQKLTLPDSHVQLIITILIKTLLVIEKYMNTAPNTLPLTREMKEGYQLLLKVCAGLINENAFTQLIRGHP